VTTEGGNFEENDSWHIHFWCSVDDGSIGASESGYASSGANSKSITIGAGGGRYASPCADPEARRSVIRTVIA
jgi:hypothetical protein